MNHLFNLDGPVLQFINKIVYSVYLNILWFICCIQVITQYSDRNDRRVYHRTFLRHAENIKKRRRQYYEGFLSLF